MTGAKVQILVNEKSFGKEQVKFLVDKLSVDLPLVFFGDPVTGPTGYAVCLYDATEARIASFTVDRPQQTCDTRPCWKLVASGYKYVDKLLSADGVLQIQLKAGLSGTGRFLAKGKRNFAKGMTALPIGVAAQLEGDRHATVQLRASNGSCVTGTVTNISDASGTLFKGKAP